MPEHDPTRTVLPAFITAKTLKPFRPNELSVTSNGHAFLAWKVLAGFEA
jgi:hypothetical protein